MNVKKRFSFTSLLIEAIFLRGLIFVEDRNNIYLRPVLAFSLSCNARERGSRDNCLRILVILASFLDYRYCASTTI